MFGIFKRKKAAEVREPEAAGRRQLREEFRRHIERLENDDERARRAAGQGISMANDFFMQSHGSVGAFVALPKPEQIAFIEKLIGMSEKLEKVDGKTALGITLFRLWLVALAAGDGPLMDSFADELGRLTETDRNPRKESPDL